MAGDVVKNELRFYSIIIIYEYTYRYNAYKTCFYVYSCCDEILLLFEYPFVLSYSFCTYVLLPTKEK